jgi:hypothetical protein
MIENREKKTSAGQGNAIIVEIEKKAFCKCELWVISAQVPGDSR